MSYYLRGCDGDPYCGGGLGVFSPPAQPAYRDPGYPPDPAIVAQNNVLSNAYDLAMAGAQAQNNRDQCEQNAQNATSPEQYAATMARCAGAYSDAGAYAAETAATPVSWYGGGSTAAPSAARAGVPARGGQLTFTSSRGGQALKVGDTWLIAITGATPNAPVTVSGSMPSGSFQGSSMGSTDSNGNFSRSGTAGAGDVGAWRESWAVGGVPAGSFSFSIAPASAAPVIFHTGGGAAAGGDAAAGAPAGGSAASSSSTVIGGFDLSSIPTWGWLGAAAAALFIMKGGR